MSDPRFPAEMVAMMKVFGFEPTETGGGIGCYGSQYDGLGGKVTIWKYNEGGPPTSMDDSIEVHFDVEGHNEHHMYARETLLTLVFNDVHEFLETVWFSHPVGEIGMPS